MARVSSKEEILLLVLRFQLKIMQISGYLLEMNQCVKCGCENPGEDLFFSFEQGGIICNSCRSGSIGAIKMHYKIKDFLKTLQDTSFEVKTRYDELATERVCEFCFNLLKKYVEFYSPKGFKTIKMLESIK